MKPAAVLGLLVISLLLTACEPEVGSKRWCEKMEKKPKSDWTFGESKDYLKHCVIDSPDD